MKLAEVSVKRPVTIIMVMLIIILLGSVSLSRLPIDLLPNMEIPIAVVVTSYTGVGPEEIEKSITNPIEGALSTVENIDTVTSTTSEGNSVVVAQFKYGTDMNFATLQMREKVDLVKRMFPSEVQAPMIMKIDPTMAPIVQLTVSQKDGDLASLQTLVEDQIKPRLERVKGAGSVTVSGGYTKQVIIKTNSEKMNGYGLSVATLSGILGAENLNAPGGQVKKGNQDLTIRTMGEFQTLEDIENLSIPLSTGGHVKLKDIAEVSLGHADMNAISRINGEQSITIAIQKQSGTNTVQVADDVAQSLTELKTTYPELEFNTVMDQSIYVKQSINSLEREALMSGLLAVFVIFLFFHNFRTTFITATAIPIALMGTFIVLYFAGVSLNMMTMGGLSLAMGRLVDDNVVALENIYRFRQEGYDKKEAAIKGVSEIAMAVMASTLTTISVFLPMAFVQGLTATLFRDLSLTVCVSLAASLLVSLTLVPTLSSKIMNAENIPESRRGFLGVMDRFSRGFDHLFGKLEVAYRKFLHYALYHRKTVVVISLVIFVLTGLSTTQLGAEFMPVTDAGQLTVTVTMPEGAKLQDTDDIVDRIEKQIKEIAEVKTVFASIGNSGTLSLSGNSPNVATVNVQLTSLQARTRSVSQVADEIRGLTKDIAGAQIQVNVTDMMSMGSTAPVDVAIKGDDLNQLKQIGNDIKGIVTSVDGTREVKTSMNEGVPEVQVHVNRQNASQFGLTAGQISQAVKGTISGTTATRYRYEGKEIDVVISGDETLKSSITNLQQTQIPTLLGISVPLSEVATVTLDRGPAAISRTGQTRQVNVTSQIINRDVNSISKDIEAKLKDYSMPDGYTYELNGQNKQMTDSFSQLGLAMALAIVLVYMVLASQFESLLHPFTIILSLPMGFSGGMLGLFVTRQNISVPAFIGLILLIGIVVSNAIVLVDYVNKRRERGEGREDAIENAGQIRLRPILMTSLATVLGLIPMALGIGEGSETMAPMAIVVVFGMAFSTLSTLLLVPVIYTIFEDIRYKRFFGRKKGKTPQSPMMTEQI
ncbi:efflux RND transporter permease subunit [Desulfitobacterium metallireducens]|uniref:Multidrug ABC transporter n=1 Tax=Desulfitobacterium metallireducens DSM 15288 TaxID=871968 RepID=W0EER6_9FIRM|nr:efflux RND transporter permease subunit [Desulfitobacterium metallireducens]AHF08023.1 multidrug ABC transporter [Desulfitobacterium metallireducens DSM 15288]